MKIRCNVIEDLLPLYVDDAVSEDSRLLVEEHLKECASCRKMQEEIKRENLFGRDKGNTSEERKKAEIQSLKKIRSNIRRKRILSVILAAVLVLGVCGFGHYWYYDRETYISSENSGLDIEGDKVYTKINPEGRLKAILSVDQKNMFYMISETPWTKKEYPTDENETYQLFDLKDFQEAHDRKPDEPADETSMPAGIENVYYVEPTDVKEAEQLWDYADEPDKAQEKEAELASKSKLIWSSEQNK